MCDYYYISNGQHSIPLKFDMPIKHVKWKNQLGSWIYTNDTRECTPRMEYKRMSKNKHKYLEFMDLKWHLKTRD